MEEKRPWRVAWLIIATLTSGTMGVAATLPAQRAPQPARSSALTGAACAACHRMPEVLSHPVGIHPRGDVGELPLEHGRLTCVTCHAIETAAEHEQARRERRPLLRTTGDPAGLCATCHPMSADRSAQHAQRLSAHLGRSGILGGGWGAGGLDEESASCVSCHDGSVVMDPAHPATASMRSADTHPIGIAYRPDRGGSLRSPADLDDRIRLFDGRVGCGSCHSPYSSRPSLLVMSNEGSALCLDCHDR